jgi:hypothetical protein
MSAYSIQKDAGQRLLNIVMRGYWDQSTFDQFAAEYSQSMRAMHMTGGLKFALVDGREFAVQSKEISEQFRDLIARNAPYHAERTATVVPTHLNKLQAERAGDKLEACYFIDMDKATAWLFAAQA